MGSVTLLALLGRGKVLAIAIKAVSGIKVKVHEMVQGYFVKFHVVF